jgi:hypothetical protein
MAGQGSNSREQGGLPARAGPRVTARAAWIRLRQGLFPPTRHATQRLARPQHATEPHGEMHSVHLDVENKRGPELRVGCSRPPVGAPRGAIPVRGRSFQRAGGGRYALQRLRTGQFRTLRFGLRLMPARPRAACAERPEAIIAPFAGPVEWLVQLTSPSGVVTPMVLCIVRFLAVPSVRRAR